MASTDELACVYAALILHDEGLECTADKISTLTKAAQLNVESFYPGLFASFLEQSSLEGLLANTGGAAPEAAAPAGEAAAAAAPEGKKAAPEDDDEEEEMAFDMFD
eukprot:TRINITY_DN680_c0_g1_i1.p2 TRINITY_DN680_c0_g1~~TRINITY_DN680_c0_g1_i1.p2  ORF type:complete len:106 (+),score=48.11 TRINITY_DN680_c0_g1_i1:56-373(+)